MVPKKTSVIDVGAFGCELFAMKWIHQGKSRWSRNHVLAYISPVLTYLLGTVPCTLTIRYMIAGCRGKRAKTHIYSKKGPSPKERDRSSKHYFSGERASFWQEYSYFIMREHTIP